MRIWKGRKEDGGSIHCLGNGSYCVYEQGPDIIQLFGPPYSSPTALGLKLAEKQGIQVLSERIPGAAVWKHHISVNSENTGEMTDFVDSELPVFLRKFELKETVGFMLETSGGAHIVKNGALSIIIVYDAGKSIYNDYPFPKKIYQQITFDPKSNVQIVTSICEGKERWVIEVGAGSSVLYIAGGETYPECKINSEKVERPGYDLLLKRTIEFWKIFTARRYDFDKIFAENLPLRKELLEAIDDVSIIIKTQQGKEGGVLAGHNYHLAYIRDQYGVSRCLLKLGYIEEAQAIMEFHYDVWKKRGYLKNAQAIGVDNIYHMHENDEVEITAYLIIQAFDLLEKIGNNEFIKKIMPMLEWA